MLREIRDVTYIPTLSVRPAEMKALEQLPVRDKDMLLPNILLRGWTTSKTLDKTIDRIRMAYDDRPWIADIDKNFRPSEKSRLVHDELEQLLKPDNGFENWCEFIRNNSCTIPCLRLEDPEELVAQTHKLMELERGVVFRIEEEYFTAIGPILDTLSNVSGFNPIIMLDFGQETKHVLLKVISAIALIGRVREVFPNSPVVLSATSFPYSFKDILDQEIYERRFFAEVAGNCTDLQIIYGDRGSARAEQRGGGGGKPAPRIDYPVKGQWNFYRKESSAPTGYFEAAKDALESPDWNQDLKLWGTQMIERTAAEDGYAIISPARATAVRINIHLHTQLFYAAPAGELLNTDDEWED